MVKLIRELVALPLRVLLLVCRFVPVVDQYALVKWIWKIGRDVEDGCSLIAMAGRKKDIEGARQWARGVLLETRSARVVYVISVLEEMSGGGLKAILDWIELAEELGCEDSYHLLPVKLNIAHKTEKYDRAEITEEMLACNFLPMEYTYQALAGKAVRLFQEGDYQKAEEIADHLLSVREDLFAGSLKAMICLGRNDDEPAHKFFGKCKKMLPAMNYYFTVAQAYLTANREDEAVEWLYGAVNAGYENKNGDPVIDRLLNSDKYAVYCAGRN